MDSILFTDISLLTEEGKLVRHAYLGVRDSRIDFIGTEDPRIKEKKEYTSAYNGEGKLIVPGMYNAHAHVPMTLLRGRGENLDLDHWLNDSIFPFEAHLTEDDVYCGTMLGIAEMLRFGTVSFSDMYYHSDARAKAIIESGIKANLGHSIVCFDSEKEYQDLPEFSLNNRLIEEYHGCANGRLLVDMNLHAEYTSTERIARGLAAATKDAGLRMQVHVSETAKEVQECKERHGLTPVAYLEHCGIFDSPSTAAHCVWLEPDDYAILARNNVFVATCPASNAKLGSGVANVDQMSRSGIQLALGTDGVASNNNHNMHTDMYLLALMQRAYNSTPLGLSSEEIITIATRNGALSQGRGDCGQIAVGACADLVVYDIDTPWMTPIDTMSSSFIYSTEGSDVVLTMVDGKILYQDGEYKTIDIERMKFEVITRQKRINSELASA